MLIIILVWGDLSGHRSQACAVTPGTVEPWPTMDLHVLWGTHFFKDYSKDTNTGSGNVENCQSAPFFLSPVSVQKWCKFHCGWDAFESLTEVKLSLNAQSQWTKCESIATSWSWNTKCLRATSKFPSTGKKSANLPVISKCCLLLYMTGLGSFSHMLCLLGQQLMHSIERNS